MRFKRARTEQYGSKDLAAMTPEQVVQAHTDGHFEHLINGVDPDAKVEHLPRCSKPELEREPVLGSVALGDPIDYRCPECSATTHINTQED